MLYRTYRTDAEPNYDFSRWLGVDLSIIENSLKCIELFEASGRSFRSSSIDQNAIKVILAVAVREKGKGGGNLGGNPGENPLVLRVYVPLA